MRLVGGPIPPEGRLEVRYKGVWGTVCDDYFNDASATVVCHMLDYKHTGRFIGNRYGPGNGTIWLDDLRCDGTERHISECSHRGWGFHNCGHDEDVAVSCLGNTSPLKITTSTSSPDIGPIIPSSPVSRTGSASSPSSPVTSTTSVQSGSEDNARYTTQIVIAAVVVLGLLLIICVIVIGLVVHFRQNPRQERTDAVMIPMPVTASSNSYNNDAFDDAIQYENAANITKSPNNNACSDVQQPSAQVAGAVGGVGTGDEYEEPTSMYESLSDDRGQRSEV